MQTRHQSDLKRHQHELAHTEHSSEIASHVAVQPDQTTSGPAPLLQFAQVTAEQSYQTPGNPNYVPPQGAYQAAQQAQQMEGTPSPVIPSTYHETLPPHLQNPDQIKAVQVASAAATANAAAMAKNNPFMLHQLQASAAMTNNLLMNADPNNKKKRKPPAQSSRKLSAWQAYAHAHAQGINISVSMHAKQLSDQWKALPPEEKEKYAELAAQLQAQRGPIVKKQKRVQTGKIYQKLKDSIDKIVHQHHTQQQTIRQHNINQQQQLQLATAGTTAATAAAATAAAMANQRLEPSDLHIAVLVFHGNSQHAEMMTYGTPSLASFYNDPHIHDIARAHASGWSFANAPPIMQPFQPPPPGLYAQPPHIHASPPPPGTTHIIQVPIINGMPSLEPDPHQQHQQAPPPTPQQ